MGTQKLVVLSLILLFSGLTMAGEKKQVMLITSERKVPTPGFYELFNSIPEIEYTEIKQVLANEWIESGLAESFALIVFYDLNDSITSSQKNAYWKLLENGMPMLFLHHTLSSYQDWPEFSHIIGGRYWRVHLKNGPSTFEHEVQIRIEPTGLNHPITSALSAFTLIDESYDNCEILPSVQPLLKTATKGSIPYTAWIHQVKNSEIVYIQNGHDDRTFNHPAYRKLIKQAIHYLTKAQPDCD